MALRSKGGSRQSKVDQVRQSNSGLSETDQNLQQPIQKEALERRVPLTDIVPAHVNARGLETSLEQLRDPETIENEAQRDEARAIVELSEAIKAEGQIQSGVAYRESGGRIRLIAGERRYWACMLSGRQDMLLRVYPEKPENLAVIHFSENVHRSDLSMAGFMRGLEEILKEQDDRGEPVTSGPQLQKLTKLNLTRANRWWAILKGPADVRQAISDRTLASETLARDISKLPAKQRQAVLNSKDPLQAFKKLSKKPSGAGGRRRSNVKLGTTRNTRVVERLVKNAAPNMDWSEVDWDDKAQVSSAFQKLLEALEKELDADADPTREA